MCIVVEWDSAWLEEVVLVVVFVVVPVVLVVVILEVVVKDLDLQPFFIYRCCIISWVRLADGK